MSVTILGIESSCDDTAAAIVRDGILLSNVIADQDVHKKYGGVVPELASRAHQQNIVPVVDQAMKDAGIKQSDLSAVAFTRGPGLMGSLLVGTSFAKGFALARKIPLVEVNHLQAHIMVHFLKQSDSDSEHPSFPFLSLLVSGGHTQLIIVKDHNKMETIGKTIDDAAGEAFDKCAKVMGLPYPGGPMVDKYSGEGNPDAFKFGRPRVGGLDYSFSGLKTSFLYFIRDHLKEDPEFTSKHRNDLCASIQRTIVEILTEKLEMAYQQTGIREIALAGGVSANSGLRSKIRDMAEKYEWKIFIPKVPLTTDNAAMIAITGYYKFLSGDFADFDITPLARMPV
ncbi:tRNA (adenosine(37)-N6)-threonylcarbamoyltransferase complex transferase subunit TsaD [Bacteroidota bacterium]